MGLYEVINYTCLPEGKAPKDFPLVINETYSRIFTAYKDYPMTSQ